MARGVKDGALAISIKAYLNDKLKEFGEVVDCSINTGKNRFTVEAMLKGEVDTVTATIERYELETEDGERFIKLVEFSSSRPWLTLLLNKLFSAKRYKIPAAVSKLL